MATSASCSGSECVALADRGTLPMAVPGRGHGMGRVRRHMWSHSNDHPESSVSSSGYVAIQWHSGHSGHTTDLNCYRIRLSEYRFSAVYFTYDHPFTS